MSRGEVLAFAGAMGGAAIGWTLGEKAKVGGVAAGVGFLAGVLGAHLVNTKLLPPPEKTPPTAGLAGYDPFSTAAAWYYVDAWVWFVGGWTPAGAKGPFWGTDFQATSTEDELAFDAHQKRPRYIAIRRFRWGQGGWVKEPLAGDWSRKYSV